MKSVFIFLFFIYFAACHINNKFPLKAMHEWKIVDIVFPSDNVRQEALKSGQYVPKNMVPVDIDVEYVSGNERRVFLTFPRFRNGIAFTLGVVQDNHKLNPAVAPYPDYSWHEDITNCENIVNAFRTSIDNCNRLWVIDNGRYSGRNVCPPKLLIFDLLTDALLDKYVLPDEVHRNFSSIISPTLDIRDDECKNTFVYLSDITGRLIVVDYDNRKSWRIENKYFYPYPPYGTFNIDGTKFELMDGILGKDLSPLDRRNPNKDRTMFFSALSSVKLGKVQTSVIRNQTTFISDTRASPDSFTLYDGERVSQSGPCVIDSNGVMFFGTHGDFSVNCWNHKKPFDRKHIERVATDKTKLPFVSGTKLVTNEQGKEELWIMSIPLQKVFTTITDDVVNFRIFVADPNKLGQACLSPADGRYSEEDYYSDYSYSESQYDCDFF